MPPDAAALPAPAAEPMAAVAATPTTTTAAAATGGNFLLSPGVRTTSSVGCEDASGAVGSGAVEGAVAGSSWGDSCLLSPSAWGGDCGADGVNASGANDLTVSSFHA